MFAAALVTSASPAVRATTSGESATTAPGNQGFYVFPSGGDDTDNIDQAFVDAGDAGPGSVVEFLQGDHCVTRPILVRSFDGVVRGAGVGVTTIRTCTDPDPFPLADFGVIDPAYPADPPYPALPRVLVFVEVEGKPATSIKVHEPDLRARGQDGARATAAFLVAVVFPSACLSRQAPRSVDPGPVHDRCGDRSRGGARRGHLIPVARMQLSVDESEQTVSAAPGGGLRGRRLVLVANDLMEHAVGRVAGGHTRGRTGLSVKGCEMSVTRCDRLDTALDGAIIRADSDRAHASYRLPGYAVPIA
jgi:hypothetical protein